MDQPVGAPESHGSRFAPDAFEGIGQVQQPFDDVMLPDSWGTAWRQPYKADGRCGAVQLWWRRAESNFWGTRTLHEVVDSQGRVLGTVAFTYQRAGATWGAAHWDLERSGAWRRRIAAADGAAKVVAKYTARLWSGGQLRLADGRALQWHASGWSRRGHLAGQGITIEVQAPRIRRARHAAIQVHPESTTRQDPLLILFACVLSLHDACDAAAAAAVAASA